MQHFNVVQILREKEFFEATQRTIIQPNTWSMQFYNDYIGEIQIYLLDEKDNRRYGVKIMGVFSKKYCRTNFRLSPVNQQQKLDVTFSYRYWTNLGTEANSTNTSLQVIE